MLILFDDVPPEKKVSKEELAKDWRLAPQKKKRILDKMYSGELCRGATVHDRKLNNYRPCSCNRLPGEELCGHHLLMKKKNVEFVDCPALRDNKVKGFIGFKKDICRAICRYWNGDKNICEYSLGRR